MGFYDATMYNEWGDLGIWQTVDNGNQTYAEIKDNEGNVLFVVEHREDGSYNYYNSYGDYVDAKINAFNNSYEINPNMLNADFSISYNPSFTNADLVVIAQQLGLTADQIDNTKLSFTYDGKNGISLQAVLPTGTTLNSQNNKSAMSLLFGDIGEAITGVKAGTNDPISKFSQDFRQIFSIYNSTPVSLFSWFGQSSLFSQVFEQATNLASSQEVKNAINYVSGSIKQGMDAVTGANLSEQEKLERIGALQDALDKMPETLSDKGYGKDAIDESLSLCDNMGYKVFVAAGDTQGYKDTLDQMTPMNKAITEAIRLFLKWALENRE